MTANLLVNLDRPIDARDEAAESSAGGPFATDAMGRPERNPRIQREADDYYRAHGFPPIDQDEYLDVDVERARRVAGRV